jgi:hypothetical protein
MQIGLSAKKPIEKYVPTWLAQHRSLIFLSIHLQKQFPIGKPRKFLVAEWPHDAKGWPQEKCLQGGHSVNYIHHCCHPS